MRLNGKVALITGGGTGIGEAAAKVFVGEGAQVVITGRRKEILEGVAKSIVANGGKVLVVAGSVTDEAHVQTAVEQTVRTFGKIDVLINNAGIGAFGTRLHETTDHMWQEVLDINLTGAFRFARAVIPHMLERGGSIVNVSSSMVRFAPPGLSAYAASKAAVDTLTRILAKELRGRDVTVNAVAPGPTATATFLSSTPAEEQEQLAALPPLGRLGSPGDIAAIVSFLVGPTGRWVNGQVIYANGGFV